MNLHEKITSDLSYLPESEATTPTEGADVMLDRWWSVHPEKGLIFYKTYSPQCNSNEQIARNICAKLYPDALVKFIPVVFVPRRMQDHRP